MDLWLGQDLVEIETQFLVGPGVEQVDGYAYRRTLGSPAGAGWLAMEVDAAGEHQDGLSSRKDANRNGP